MADPVPKGLTSQPQIYGRILPMLPKDKSLRILDVGAGEGYFTKLLKEAGHDVEALDYVEEDFVVKGVPFHQADLSQKIPLPDNEYDCVVSIEVIEHVENHFHFMRELLRITKPGGMVILTTPNVSSMTSRWYFLRYGFNDCAPMPLDPHLEEYWMEHINPISVPEILYLFERFGADMVDLTTNRIRRSAWLPTMLLYPFLWLGMRIKFLRKKFGERLPLHRRHVKWMLSRANLMGRITIAVGRKRGG